MVPVLATRGKLTYSLSVTRLAINGNCICYSLQILFTSYVW